MTEAEIKEYLGFGHVADHLRLRPHIIKGMRDVPVPVTDMDHISAFRSWLKCAGPPPVQIFIREGETP